MKSCGVIVEYNPLHNGHLYHLEQARQRSGADVIVGVMSGSFLQRGEPSLLDKWTRAHLALAAGADMVVELPVAFAIQPADYFARGAIGILQALQVTDLCFGSETGEGAAFEELAALVNEQQEVLDQAFKKITNKRLSYAEKMSQVYQEVLPQQLIDLQQPNNILGFSYAVENHRLKKPMTLHSMKREQAGYHDAAITAEIASATAIRQALFQAGQQVDWAKTVPTYTEAALKTQELVNWSAYWPLLRYQIVSASLEELRAIYQVNDGLEYRLKEQILKAENFEDFVTLVKSKQNTWVKIQRICLYILLNIQQTEMLSAMEKPEYIRLLGFNQKGRQFLKQQKKKIALPVITNIDKKNEALLSLDIRAGQVYQMVKKEAAIPLDYYRKPIILP
ncbi:nucleotidyltransferase [Isobaculum melis]|uniref:tRNA(Met) cytidine acetate ligase n=1 Tax=Isobaculum melis TaxID=142588 RepID=A0A1H9T778_9LACT|nr:nucleotidyltransferase [Isobaculum melis]SER93110.1 Predicted nucleotidyltransferase [Isobaculum melis]